MEDVDGLGTISYQWKADGVSISGATSDKYTLTEVTAGQVISVVAKYTDGYATNESVSSGKIFSVNENITPSTVIYTATGTSVLGGAGASNFSVNSSTGTITFVSSPDFEIKSSYNFTVDGKLVAVVINNLDDTASHAPFAPVEVDSSKLSDGKLNALEVNSPLSLRVALNLTGNNDPALGDVVAPQAGDTFSLYDGDSLIRSFALSVEEASTGIVELVLNSATLQVLSEGLHALKVQLTDAANNLSDFSAALEFTKDTSVSVLSGLTIAGLTDQLSKVAGHVVSGSAAENGATIKVYDFGVEKASMVDSDGGAWSFGSLNFGEGLHKLSVTQTDTAGNISAILTAPDFTIDSTAAKIAGKVAAVKVAVGSIAASTDAVFHLSFTEALRDGTLTASDFLLTGYGSGTKAGSVTAVTRVDASHYDVSVNITSASSGNAFVLGLTGQYEDLAGNYGVINSALTAVQIIP